MAGSPKTKTTNRRAPAVVDPFALWSEGETRLRDSLAALSVDQLKDVVSEYGMDRSRLALKWRTPERLIGLIVETVAARATKGDAFRSESRHESSAYQPHESSPPEYAASVPDEELA